MIARYSRPAMAQIWDDRRRYQVWLRVELAVCEEMVGLKLIPKKEWRELQSKVQALLKRGGVDPARVDEHEKVTRHDVIAFTTAVTEQIGPISRYIHFGLTSSDVVDTSLSISVLEAGALLREGIVRLLKILAKRARQYRRLPTIGRSHGIFAEPTSFGLKFLGWYCEWQRNLERLDRALANMAYGKLSGAVGVNPHWGPKFETRVLKKLGLKREPVSTQVVPRDRHAELMMVLALCGSSMERIAVELRHLQRSEVGEVLESFQKGQKGSSAMPHKRNPISSENLTGCARLLRSYAQASLENVALWHERDISHSSVERITFPDATILLDYALDRLNRILEGLVVREDQVAANVKKAGNTVFSGHFLLELVRAGATREEAYSWVQQCALESLEGRADFVALLSQHPEVSTRLPQVKIRELASMKYQLRSVDEIFVQAGFK
ncbi:adenylosuccinate lyase [Bdellovibrionota bacterium FG-1]